MIVCPSARVVSGYRGRIAGCTGRWWNEWRAVVVRDADADAVMREECGGRGSKGVCWVVSRDGVLWDVMAKERDE